KAKAIFEASLVENDRLAKDIIQQLKDDNCDFPKDLKIDFHFIDQPTTELGEIKEKGFHIQYDRQELAKTDIKPHAQLVVVSGIAEQEQYTMSKTGIHLGRLPKVTDQNGNVIRCNDVAFLDIENEINPTVSRSHAHIRFDEKNGEFRLYDDDSACGTRIFREGYRIEVPQGGRGIKLHPGDEIYLGHACIRFEVRDSR
ncbi:MAG: FHA domain-containing protein, partial [Candidatus Tectomicrobia bacterium]|nr:FHA domain-containing protein [Candidatus Tectomicrobia bacterium]